ncbi:hypothetical protein QBC39DRAFT_270161 [Podospora conica]|nr:hypothetical protein QBC39DRAFT_270161 [Schizothecium conicum]
MGHESDDSPTPSISRPSQSGRKGSKKVRTGCITCKIRKVKCDEGKPFCMRCTKTGRRCDGYLDAKSMAQRRRRAGQLLGAAGADPQGPLPLFFEWASADEKRSFHFFQHATAPCLSGDFDGDFWRVLVLRICQTEPAVKHAVLAVSSFHEAMTTPYMDAEDRHSFALSQYNKAIAYLLDQMQNVEAKPLVPLLTCVLFVCIELMQNKDKESLLHLEQGRQILSQLGRKTPSRYSEIDIIRQHLVPMYTRLSLTSWLIGCDPVAIPQQLKMLTEIPTMFDSVAEVRYALYDFMDECLRFYKRTHEAKFDDIPEESLSAFEKEQDYLLAKHAKFNVAFSLYQAMRVRDAPPGAIALIQIHLHTTYIWVSTALAYGEAAFDSYTSTFSAIIPLAASFLDVISHPATREDQSGKLSPGPTSADPRHLSSMFTFEMHVIAPLYYVATKCRHPMIRRAALELLRRHPTRQENLWRANIMAAIADHTIELEERHLRVTRSVSPSHGSIPPSAPPFPASFVPNEPWGDTEMSNALPFHQLFRPEPITQHQQQQQQSQRPPHQQRNRSYDYTAAAPAAGTPPSGPRHSSGPATPSDALDLSDLASLSRLPIDPSLLYDTSAAASSIASSFEELSAPPSTIFVGGGSSSRNNNSRPPPPIYAHHPHPHPHQQPMPPGISLEPPTPLDAATASGPGARDDPHHQQQPQQNLWMMFPPSHHVDAASSSSTRLGSSSSDSCGGGAMSARGGGLLSFSSASLGPRSADAPYDVPERFRVHEAVIGSEKEDGSWVMMFRKLGGLDGGWDVRTEWVAVA